MAENQLVITNMLKKILITIILIGTCLKLSSQSINIKIIDICKMKKRRITKQINNMISFKHLDNQLFARECLNNQLSIWIIFNTRMLE